MRERATFAAGCFWGVEKTFRHTAGVISTQVGYTGGHVPHVTYPEVCSGRTGHAEAVEITFDSEQIHYQELLDLFFSLHDPTSFHRQGPDIGSQYRSAIFVHSEEQERQAKEKIASLNASGKFAEPLVTEVQQAGPFYRAEEYHQCYLEKREQKWE